MRNTPQLSFVLRYRGNNTRMDGEIPASTNAKCICTLRYNLTDHGYTILHGSRDILRYNTLCVTWIPNTILLLFLSTLCLSALFHCALAWGMFWNRIVPEIGSSGNPQHATITAADPSHLAMITPEKHQHYDRQHPSNTDQESCPTCLYTGVGTCVGLSGYFLFLAMEEDQQPKNNNNNNQKWHDKISSPKQSTQITSNNNKTKIQSHIPKPQSTFPRDKSTSFTNSVRKFVGGNPALKKHRPFLFACSAVWAAAGVYRVYLD